MLQDIGKIILNVSKDGRFRSWGHVAKDELLWSMLINNIGSSKKFYYYNEWYDDTGWNRRSEFPDPPIREFALSTGWNRRSKFPDPPIREFAPSIQSSMFISFIIIISVIEHRFYNLSA